ncbi:hypothetical protein AX774_g4468, partial [Zancudomyces culisetae]
SIPPPPPPPLPLSSLPPHHPPHPHHHPHSHTHSHSHSHSHTHTHPPFPPPPHLHPPTFSHPHIPPPPPLSLQQMSHIRPPVLPIQTSDIQNNNNSRPDMISHVPTSGGAVTPRTLGSIEANVNIQQQQKQSEVSVPTSLPEVPEVEKETQLLTLYLKNSLTTAPKPIFNAAMEITMKTCAPFLNESAKFNNEMQALINTEAALSAKARKSAFELALANWEVQRLDDRAALAKKQLENIESFTQFNSH